MKYSLYKWEVMSMGLINAPTKFMNTMNTLFSNILDLGMVVFLDDILIYSHMVRENSKLLKKVLAHLYQYMQEAAL